MGVYAAAAFVHHLRHPSIRPAELEAEVRRRMREAGYQLIRATSIDPDTKREVLELFEAYIGEAIHDDQPHP